MIDVDKLWPTLMVASITGAGLTFTASNFLKDRVESQIKDLFKNKHYPTHIINSFSKDAGYTISNAAYLTAFLFLVSGFSLFPYIINTNFKLAVIISYLFFISSLFILMVVSFIYLLTLEKWIFSNFENSNFFKEFS